MQATREWLGGRLDDGRRLLAGLAPGSGQGTVEYLGLIVAIGALLAVVMTEMHGAQEIGKAISAGFRSAIEKVVGH
jgi:hypothetical protein